MPGAQNGPVTSPKRPTRSIDNIDPDDPDYIKDLQRPAAIKEDMNEMERRKRVRQILESKSFRHELEQLITHERQHGNNPENLKALEQLSELILPKPQMTHAGPLGNISSSAVVPIADIRGPEAAAKYTKLERLLRNKLASLFRLVDLFQWSPQGIQNHATLRITQDNDHILTNPHGLLYHEVTSGCLLNVDFEGNLVDSGTTGLGLNRTEFMLHSTIHQSRPDIRCVIHLHVPVVGAVAAMKCGFLPISQEAMIVGPVSFHDYDISKQWDNNVRDQLVHDLGPNNKVLFLPNNGFAVGGESVEEAFHLVSNLINACEAQVRAARAGIENLNIPTDEAQKAAYAAARIKAATHRPGGDRGGASGAVKWRMGELEWEAWMRVLDNAGFRTGHLYRQPLLKSKTSAPQSDVEVPPAITAYGAVDESGEPLSPHKLAALRAAQEKVRWLNSPNAYQKVEVTETGTAEPKTITKWVPDTESAIHSTPIKIDSPHQFSPLSSNPKEFKEKQKEIKEARRGENITSGPVSHVFDADKWEKTATLQDAHISGTGDHVVVVGAVSQGIIQRDHQHNAQLYRQVYQPNPFANETEEDIEAYKREVGRKGGDPALEDTPHVDDDDDVNANVYDLKSHPVASKPEAAPRQRSVDIDNGVPAVSTPPESGHHSPGLRQETTFGTNHATTVRFVPASQNEEPRSRSSQRHTGGTGGFSTDIFRRTKSDRFHRPHPGKPEGTEERSAVSDDEGGAPSEGDSPTKKKDKKKKFKTPSFLKRKKKAEE